MFVKRVNLEVEEHQWKGLGPREGKASIILANWLLIFSFALSTNLKIVVMGTMEMFHNWPNFTNFLSNLSRKMGSSLTMSLSEGISQMGITVSKSSFLTYCAMSLLHG